MSVIVSLQGKACSKCEEVKTLDEFSRDKANKDRYRSQCKVCCKEYSAKYYAANSEKVKEYSAKYYAANSEKVKEYSAKHHAANPEKSRAKCAKRRAAKLLAIPSWLTKEDYQAMEAICKEADRLTQETGIKHHVDHIHPLQGKLVCGFHCPSNLQILTESENCSKHNKFTPYVESELLV